MEIILLPAIIVGVWLVLRHIRQHRFLNEYMELQKKALEKGVTLPNNLKDLVTFKIDWSAVTLRIGILSLILGIMGVIIGAVILPQLTFATNDADAPYIFASFWIFGLLIATFGLGNLICWLLIDRRRDSKTDKGE